MREAEPLPAALRRAELGERQHDARHVGAERVAGGEDGERVLDEMAAGRAEPVGDRRRRRAPR